MQLSKKELPFKCCYEYQETAAGEVALNNTDGQDLLRDCAVEKYCYSFEIMSLCLNSF